MTTPRVEIFETETQRGIRFPADMSIAERIEAALEIFDASLVRDLAAVERDIRAEYVVDDEDVDVMMSLVRAKTAYSELI
jgi:hypothetical protein